LQPNLTPDSAPIVVDRVEWVPGSPEAVEVRVYGRWRDRPPEGPLALVVEHGGRVDRFDPVAGAPGAILSFAVPNEMRARLAQEGALALTLGSDRVALAPAVPGSVAPDQDALPSGTVVDRAVLAERRARRAELAEESLARRAAEAEGTVSTLEAQLANLEERLAQAAAECDELEATVAERECTLRAAEQREYAEQQRRVEAEDELSAARRAAEAELGDLRGRLREAGERADELARELSRARRAVAQAQEAARHERRERERLEAGVYEREDALSVAEEDLEAEVVALRGRADELARDLAAERSARAEVEKAELTLVALRQTAVELQGRLDAERRARAESEVALRADLLREREAFQRRIVEAEVELRAQIGGQRQAFADQVAAVERTVVELRGQLGTAAGTLRERLDAERAGREAAEADLASERARLEQERLRIEAQVDRVREQIALAITELRAQLEAERAARWAVEAELALARTELDEMRADAATREAESERMMSDLQTAAQRLRAQAPPLADEDEEAAAAAPAPQMLAPRVAPASARRPRPWLAPSIAAFAAQDPQAAGRLVVALLPVQHTVLRHPVVYALTIEEVGAFLVRARPGEVVVEPGSVPGGTSDIAFHLTGPAAALAQMAGGGARRRLRGTRVSGSRRQLRRLLRRLRTPIGLADARRAGVLLDPGQVLGVLGAGVDPAWTAGHDFSVVWDVRGPQGGTWTVSVAGGLPVTVTEGAPDAEPAATVHVSHGALMSLLAGEPLPPGDPATVDGDADAVALLGDWAHRVQGLAG
jgi:predicted  nucleic acid-binding Zn-ribbon protein